MGLLALTFLALTYVSLAGEHTYAGACKYKLYSAFGFGCLELKWKRSNKLRPLCFENRTRYGKGRRRDSVVGMVTWFVSWNRISIPGTRKIFSNSVRLDWHRSPHSLLFSGYGERPAYEGDHFHQTASRARMRGTTTPLSCISLCHAKGFACTWNEWNIFSFFFLWKHSRCVNN
jgi:hypothetical protein